MREQTSKFTVALFSLLPLFVMCIFTPRKVVVQNENAHDDFTMHSDTIPLTEKMEYDTIITFDLKTKTESVKIVRRDPPPPEMRVDTIISWDPKTKIETMDIVRRPVPTPGTIDTIYVFDPETKKERMYIVRNN